MSKRRWLIGVGIVLLGLVAIPAADQAALWWATRAPQEEAGRVAALAGVAPGQVVAEIGAGVGEMAREMAPRVVPGGRLVITELGDAQLEDLRDMVAQAGWQHVEVRRGELAGTGLSPDCCALIYMRHVFHHFGDPAAMSRALYESVAPGGRVVVIDFPPNWFLGLVAPVVHDGNAGHGITMEALTGYLTAAGFMVERSDPDWTSGSFMVMGRK